VPAASACVTIARVRATAFLVLRVLEMHGEPAPPERVTARLEYVRDDAAATECPDEATFRTLVQARLGYDPFDDGGSLALRVDLRSRAREIAASLLLVGETGEKRTERTLRHADCFELLSSVALAAAIAVDPDAMRAGGVPKSEPTPAPTPEPTPAPSATEPRPEPARPSPQEGTRSRWRATRPGARLTAALVMPVGLTPAPRGGARVGLGVQGGVWSVVAEGVVLFPSSHAESFGSVSSFVAHGSLVPCGHLPVHPIVRVDLCAVGSLGAMHSDAAEVTRSDPQRHMFATAGPRAGITVMPRPRLGVAAVFDMPVNLARAHLMIADEGEPREAWVASRVGFVAGLGLVLHLP
jgi:hypothetical protein